MPAHFVGNAKFEHLPSGAAMRLIEPFAFVDPKGEEWPVPAGAVTDGASIPGWLKGFIGGSFDGPYRIAAVIHDWYCDVRTRGAAETHRAFFDAMLCAEVELNRARLMYFAVRERGPRWNLQAILNTRLATGAPPPKGPLIFSAPAEGAGAMKAMRSAPPAEFDRAGFDAMRARIEAGQMSVEEIEAATPFD